MTATPVETTTIPGYRSGTWHLDPSHSQVGFTVRHMMVSKVRGHFHEFSATVETGDAVTNSSVSATVELASITTGNEQRDNHLRSPDFFQLEQHPQLTFRSSGIRQDGDDWIVDGDLTINGITRAVPLRVRADGFAPDAYGGYRAGFTAQAHINRRDFGVDWNAAIEAGGVVVSDRVDITIEAQLVLQD